MIKAEHDKYCPEHSGKRGHYCWDWDGLWICEDCQEFKVCTCVMCNVIIGKGIMVERVREGSLVNSWILNLEGERVRFMGENHLVKGE